MREPIVMTERDKFCCFGCATTNLVLGTPAFIYIFQLMHAQVNIWIVIILAIFLGQLAIPVAILSWILVTIF